MKSRKLLENLPQIVHRASVSLSQDESLLLSRPARLCSARLCRRRTPAPVGRRFFQYLEDVLTYLPITRRTNLTLALCNSTTCDPSTDPTVHISAFANSSLECFSVKVWEQNNYSLNGTDSRAPHIDYNVSNRGAYSNGTYYSSIWYQQLSGDSSQDAKGKTLGTLLVETFPCENCATSCSDEGTTATSGAAFTTSTLKVGSNEWLQWDCFAEGQTYVVPYDIKGFTIKTAVDNYDSINLAEDDGKCELAAVFNRTGDSATTSLSASATTSTSTSSSSSNSAGGIPRNYDAALYVMAACFMVVGLVLYRW
jgi:trimeric autotransporter adhesin